ncbi:MAG: PLP-dependent aminotransferase family protein [bacterium]|nr:PLP-dependent aminotransferase family protein [bacterium]
MFHQPQLDNQSGTSLYRQLYRQIKIDIERGHLVKGDRLPATRELAGQLGLNRTTITAAYELLETEGLIRRHVGRGSFVAGETTAHAEGLRWQDLLTAPGGTAAGPLALRGSDEVISFATSRPSEELFPIEALRAITAEVMSSASASEILQLGSPSGYGPLRRHLLKHAQSAGVARSSDDIIITNGCQQALDLLQRVLIGQGDAVIVEDPVYPGVHHVLERAGARVAGVPVGPRGIELDSLERALTEHSPKAVVLTPNFQNPTGATLPRPAREAIVRMTKTSGAVLVENDIYGELRYQGAAPPTLKRLDASGDVVQMSSFSKVAFPGLRVGWVIGPRPLVNRLIEAKQWSDLHTDQLSQAVLLRFAESGALAAHRKRVVRAGVERLAATVAACERHLPEGTRYTHPDGGMNLWIELPEPLDAGELLSRAQREMVSYLPGKYFAVSRSHAGSLRLSFAGLPPKKIRHGIAVLGEIFSSEVKRVREAARMDAAPAMV